jgi:hypothetical protein
MESGVLAVENVFAARLKSEELGVRNGADNFNKQGKCLTGPTKPASSQPDESFSFQLMQGCMQQQRSILAKMADLLEFADHRALSCSGLLKKDSAIDCPAANITPAHHVRSCPRRRFRGLGPHRSPQLHSSTIPSPQPPAFVRPSAKRLHQPLRHGTGTLELLPS